MHSSIAARQPARQPHAHLFELQALQLWVHMRVHAKAGHCSCARTCMCLSMATPRACKPWPQRTHLYVLEHGHPKGLQALAPAHALSWMGPHLHQNQW